ncbi:MAG: hypothetical protein ACO4BZ_11810, partial [Ilumatobacteraceae bacterium]
PNEQHADHRNEKTPHHRHPPPLLTEHPTSIAPYPGNASRLAQSTCDHSDLSMRSAPIVPQGNPGVTITSPLLRVVHCEQRSSNSSPKTLQSMSTFDDDMEHPAIR